MPVNWKRGEGLAESERDHRPSSLAPGETSSFVAPPASMPRSLLGADTVVTGRLSFTAPTRIDGTLRGEVRASELLVIGEGGFVDGTVRAQRLVVLGKMRGDVRGADRVEIGPNGQLTGTIETRSLVVQDGGQLDGDCRIQPAGAKVHTLYPAPAPENA